MEFILRFTFSHPDMDTNIVGTINPAHLQDNINALLQGPLPAAIYVEAKRRLEAAVDLAPEIPRGAQRCRPERTSQWVFIALRCPAL